MDDGSRRVVDVPDEDELDRLESMEDSALVSASASVLLRAPLASCFWMASAIRFLPEWV